MNDTAISVKNLSKSYKMYPSPTKRFKELIHPFGKKYHHEFCALRDVSFEVRKGESIGIIGRNGSGKSTLLQILCGILQPTIGEVKVNGRISALLELGAGFNRDFTGRENVYMSGAIMGLTKEEMDERFGAIAEFADIGDFIEQPVKTYSSGMYVRLAFAAAINVDPDILIVDEALAVGDAKFQHKCYANFREFQERGKTIIFVTHDMTMVLKHCDSAVLLENGAVFRSGKPNAVVNCYYDLVFTGSAAGDRPGTTGKEVGTKNEGIGASASDVETLNTETELDRFLKDVPSEDNCGRRKSYNKDEYRYGDRRAEIRDFLVVANNEYDPVSIWSGDMVDIYVKMRFNSSVALPMFGFAIKTVDGVVVYGNNTRYTKFDFHPAAAPETVVIRWSLKMDIAAGDYFINLGIAEKVTETDTPIDNRKDLIHISVMSQADFAGFVHLDTVIEEVARLQTVVVR